MEYGSEGQSVSLLFAGKEDLFLGEKAGKDQRHYGAKDDHAQVDQREEGDGNPQAAQGIGAEYQQYEYAGKDKIRDSGV